MITTKDPADFPQASSNDHPADHFLEAHCNACGHTVDAVCPKCGTHVESGGEEESRHRNDGRTLKSVLTPAEFYRRLILMLLNARNTKFTLACLMIATGDGAADGVSMTDLAAKWGVGKATVSKQCRFICEYLGIPPSQYMRKEETAAKFRLSNRRPTATKK